MIITGETNNSLQEGSSRKLKLLVERGKISKSIRSEDLNK